MGRLNDSRRLGFCNESRALDSLCEQNCSVKQQKCNCCFFLQHEAMQHFSEVQYEPVINSRRSSQLTLRALALAAKGTACQHIINNKVFRTQK
jgi:hypothetical protein